MPLWSRATLSILAIASVTIAGAMIAERLYWRWFQGIKIGESTGDWPFISESSFWLSFPWFAITLLFAAWGWYPTTGKRWAKRVVIALSLLEAAIIWWMASVGLSPAPA